MKAAIYYRISSQEQEILLLEQGKQIVDYVNKNGLSFIVCSRCNGEWIVNTFSKEELIGKIKYLNPKCPACDERIKRQ